MVTPYESERDNVQHVKKRDKLLGRRDVNHVKPVEARGAQADKPPDKCEFKLKALPDIGALKPSPLGPAR